MRAASRAALAFKGTFEDMCCSALSAPALNWQTTSSASAQVQVVQLLGEGALHFWHAHIDVHKYLHQNLCT